MAHAQTFSFPSSWTTGNPTTTVQHSDSDGTFTLSWPGGESVYYLQQITPSYQNYTTSGTSYSFSNLADGTYDFRLTGCHDEYDSGMCMNMQVCRSNTTIIRVIVQRPAPATPASLNVPGSDADGAYTVSWSSVSGATGYELQEQTNGGSFTTIQNNSATSRAISGKGNGSYDYRVRACNGAGCSGFTSVYTTHVAIAPDIPSSLHLTLNTSGTSLSLSWNSANGSPSYYELQRSINGGGWSTVYTGGNLSQSYSGLSSGSYHYQVRACRTTGSYTNCGGWRQSIMGYIAGGANDQGAYAYAGWGGATTTIQYVDFDGSFTLSWPSANKEYYYLTQQGPVSQTYTITGLSRSFTALPNGLYTFTVAGCHTEYNSSSCQYGEVCTTNSRVIQVLVQKPVPQVPNPPTAPVHDDDGNYDVSWNSVPAAMSYELQEQTNGGGWGTVQNTSATSRNITGKGTGVYGYQVRACNDTGCSGYSTTMTTTVTIPPSVPNFISLSVDGQSIAINWGASSGVVEYELHRRLNNGSWTFVHRGPEQGLTLGLTVAGNYEYRVSACAPANGTGNCSDWRQSAAVSIPGTAANGSAIDQGSYQIAQNNDGNANKVRYVDRDGTFTLSWLPINEHHTLVQQGPVSQTYKVYGSSQSFNLLPNGLYTFTVTGCYTYMDPVMCSDFEICDNSVKLIIEVLVVKPMPDMPSGFHAPKTDNDGEYWVGWHSTSVTHYYRFQEQVNGGGWHTLENMKPSNNTNYLVRNRSNGTYSYRVSACSDVGCSNFTEVKTVVVTKGGLACGMDLSRFADDDGCYIESEEGDGAYVEYIPECIWNWPGDCNSSSTDNYGENVPEQYITHRGKVYARIWPASGGDAQPSLEQLLIVVAGYDPGEDFSMSDAQEYFEQFANVLHMQGYDILVLNYGKHARKYIQSQAAALVRTLKRIEELRDGLGMGTDRKQHAILGLSMGGLNARYALTQMESTGVPHGTKVLITFDTPHRGANIPVGGQRFFNFMQTAARNAAREANKISGIYSGISILSGIALDYYLFKLTDDMAAEAYDSKQLMLSLSTTAHMLADIHLNNPAATQTLINHHHGGNHIDGGHYLRREFYEHLQAMGNYPTNLYKVAFTNGSVTGRRVNNLAPGQAFISYNHKPDKVRLELDIREARPGAMVFRGKLRGPAGNTAGSAGLDDTNYHYEEYYARPLHAPIDDIAGGYGFTFTTLAKKFNENRSDFAKMTPLVSSHSFIPTYSGLDLDLEALGVGAGGDLLAAATAQGKTLDDPAFTPFDKVYYPSNFNNMLHLELSDEFAGWLLEEITNPPRNNP